MYSLLLTGQYSGYNFSDFLFAFLHIKNSSDKGSFPKNKKQQEFLLLTAFISFLSKNPFPEGRQKIMIELPPFKI